MNWPLFALLSWVLFGLELGFRDALRLGPTPIAPSFVVPFVVFIALSSPPNTLRIAALTLGLVTDLTFPVELRDGGPTATVVGPYALGYLLASQLVLTLRSMMIRRNPLTIAFLSVLAAVIAQIVVVALFTTRSIFGDPITWNATHELLTRLASSLTCSVSGLVLSFGLLPLAPMLGINIGPARRNPRR